MYITMQAWNNIGSVAAYLRPRVSHERCFNTIWLILEGC